MGTQRVVKASPDTQAVAAQNSWAPHSAWLLHSVGMSAQDAIGAPQKVTSSIVVKQTPPSLVHPIPQLSAHRSSRRNVPLGQVTGGAGGGGTGAVTVGCRRFLRFLCFLWAPTSSRARRPSPRVKVPPMTARSILLRKCRSPVIASDHRIVLFPSHCSSPTQANGHKQGRRCPDPALRRPLRGPQTDKEPVGITRRQQRAASDCSQA